MTKKLFTAEETTILGIFPSTDYKEATMEEKLGYMKAKSNLSASTDPIEWDTSTKQFRIQGDMLESDYATYEKGRCVRKQTSPPPCGKYTVFLPNPPTKKGDDNMERIHFEEGHPCYTRKKDTKKDGTPVDDWCEQYMTFDESGKGTGKPVKDVDPEIFNRDYGGVCDSIMSTAVFCSDLKKRNNEKNTKECEMFKEIVEKKNIQKDDCIIS